MLCGVDCEDWSSILYVLPSTMYRVGVMISYKFEVAVSIQLHLCSKWQQGIIDPMIYNSLVAVKAAE